MTDIYVIRSQPLVNAEWEFLRHIKRVFELGVAGRLPL